MKLEDSENGNPRFDIGFFVNEVEIEPKAEVSISIKYLNENWMEQKLLITSTIRKMVLLKRSVQMSRHWKMVR